jgi:5-methylcytosine-specific restriction endonuclease McrA
MKPLGRADQRNLDRAFVRAFRVDAASGQENKCAYCRDDLTSKSISADHIDPRSNRGKDGRNNILASCRKCNSVKGSMPVILFQQKIANPKHGDNIHIWLIWSSRRINARLEKFQARMNRLFGVSS